MKYFLITGLFVIFTSLLVAGPIDPPLGTPVMKILRVYVDNVKEAKGTIWVGIYESEDDFLDREKARLVSVEINGLGRAYIEIPDMIVGKDYALGLFHDVNDNGEFDTNWLGLPAEPWAFSGKPRTRLRLPYFSEVSFEFNMANEDKTVRLRKW
jgi:uncharacterized protein (DUF2141 family)